MQARYKYVRADFLKAGRINESALCSTPENRRQHAGKRMTAD